MQEYITLSTGPVYAVSPAGSTNGTGPQYHDVLRSARLVGERGIIAMNRLALPLTLVLLASCTPREEPPELTAAYEAFPYDRDLYRHWVDADGDCQDTRQEVLIDESRIPVTLNPTGCFVVAGEWVSAYDGEVFTDPGDLRIDHLVPLAEAHRSGAVFWDAERREAFANDLGSPDSLIVVPASVPRSDRDGDPAAWLPPDPSRCAYIQAWVDVKARWQLDINFREGEVIRWVTRDCEDFTWPGLTSREQDPMSNWRG